MADLFLLALVLVLAVVALYEQIGKRPLGPHAWAESDRLAIAYQLHDHENNPLINRTWTSWTKENRVGVEFPLQGWIAATGGRILGREAISTIMRTVTALSVLTGIWLMSMLVREKTRHLLPAAAFAVFAMGAPVVLYYSANYLLDGFVLGLVLCGFYFLFRFWETLRYKDFHWSLVFLYTAAVCKVSAFWFVPAGLSVFWVWWHNKDRLSFGKIFVPQAVGFALFSLNILKMKHDQQHFSSGEVFLAKLMPVHSFPQLGEVIQSVLHTWWWQYLVPLAWVAFAGLVFLGLRAKPKGSISGHKKVWVVSSLLLLGAFVGAFTLQFQSHDYYVLATFFPLVYSSAAFFLVHLWRRRRRAVVGFLLLTTVAAVVGIRQNHARQQKHFFTWVDNSDTYEGCKKHFPAQERYQAKVAVLWEWAPNIALQWAEQYGYHIEGGQNFTAKLGQALDDPAVKYVMYPNHVEGEISELAGGMLKGFSPHAREEKFTILKRW